MRKQVETITCDNCKKKYYKEKPKYLYIEAYAFDICDECYEIISNIKLELRELDEEYEKKRNAIFDKTNLFATEELKLDE